MPRLLGRSTHQNLQPLVQTRPQRGGGASTKRVDSSRRSCASRGRVQRDVRQNYVCRSAKIHERERVAVAQAGQRRSQAVLNDVQLEGRKGRTIERSLESALDVIIRQGNVGLCGRTRAKPRIAEQAALGGRSTR